MLRKKGIRATVKSLNMPTQCLKQIKGERDYRNCLGEKPHLKKKVSANCCFLCHFASVLNTSCSSDHLLFNSTSQKKGRANRDKDDQRWYIKDEHKIIKYSKGWIRNICSQLLTTKDWKGNQMKYSNAVYYMHNNILFHACGTHRLWMTTKKYKWISCSLWMQYLLSANLYCPFLEVAKVCLGIFHVYLPSA